MCELLESNNSVTFSSVSPVPVMELRPSEKGSKEKKTERNRRGSEEARERREGKMLPKVDMIKEVLILQL